MVKLRGVHLPRVFVVLPVHKIFNLIEVSVSFTIEVMKFSPLQEQVIV